MGEFSGSAGELAAGLQWHGPADHATRCVVRRRHGSAPSGSNAPRCIMRAHVALQRMPYG